MCLCRHISDRSQRGSVSWLIPTRTGRGLRGKHHENEKGMKTVHHFIDYRRISLLPQYDQSYSSQLRKKKKKEVERNEEVLETLKDL